MENNLLSTVPLQAASETVVVEVEETAEGLGVGVVEVAVHRGVAVEPLEAAEGERGEARRPSSYVCMGIAVGGQLEC